MCSKHSAHQSCTWSSKASVCGGTQVCSLYLPCVHCIYHHCNKDSWLSKLSTTALSRRNKIICPNLKYTHTLVHREAESDSTSSTSRHPNPTGFQWPWVTYPPSTAENSSQPRGYIKPLVIFALPSLRHVSLAGWWIQKEPYINNHAHMQILTAPSAQQSCHRTFLEHWSLWWWLKQLFPTSDHVRAMHSPCLSPGWFPSLPLTHIAAWKGLWSPSSEGMLLHSCLQIQNPKALYRTVLQIFSLKKPAP